MRNQKKLKKFVQATRSLAYWSKELLKIIEDGDNSKGKKVVVQTEKRALNAGEQIEKRSLNSGGKS